MNRRQFVQRAAIATAVTTMLPSSMSSAADEKPKGVHWPIGCFNRPWAGDKKNWGFDAALDGIKAAGYKGTGLLTRSAKEPLTGSDAMPEYLADLKKLIAGRGLAVNITALRTKDEMSIP